MGTCHYIINNVPSPGEEIPCELPECDQTLSHHPLPTMMVQHISRVLHFLRGSSGRLTLTGGYLSGYIERRHAHTLIHNSCVRL